MLNKITDYVYLYIHQTQPQTLFCAIFGLIPLTTTPTTPSTTTLTTHIRSIWNSYITLFWALFGLMPLSTVRESSVQTFTRRIGETLLMVYHIMVIIVLINMLIAMMSSSFQEIEVLYSCVCVCACLGMYGCGRVHMCLFVLCSVVL